MLFRKARLGQSIIEYTLLIAIVGAALTAMVTYISRALNSRTKEIQDDFSESLKS